MPYKSDAQRRYMHAKHPGIAKKWDKEYPHQKGLPEHAKKKGEHAAKHAFDITPIIKGTAIGALGVGGANGLAQLIKGNGLETAIGSVLKHALPGAAVGAAGGGIYSMFKKDPEKQAAVGTDEAPGFWDIATGTPGKASGKLLNMPWYIERKEKKKKKPEEAAKEAALNEFGITKEALNMGILGRGVKAVGGALEKIPGIGGIAGGLMGAYQGYQSGGIGGALTHGALGAATGSMGLMGIPVQAAGEHVLGKLEAPKGPAPMQQIQQMGHSPFQYGA